MKKKLLVILAIMLALSGCGDKETPASPVSTNEPVASSAASKVYDSSKEPPVTVGVQGPVARLREKDNDTYRDVTIQKGNSYTPDSRFGYRFEGYQDDAGVTYIDSKGKVTRDYNGTGILVLWAQFSPEEYTFAFCDDGKELSQINKAVCKFDSLINLPIGDVVTDSQGNRSVVTALSTSTGELVATYKNQNVCPKDFFTGSERPGSTIQLNIVTSQLSYIEQKGTRFDVHNGDYLKQNFDGDGLNCDAFSLSDSVDVDALRALGYKNVDVHYECVINGSKGAPHLLILSSLPESDKGLKEVTLYDSEKIKDKISGNEETFMTDESGGDAVVAIENIEDTVYVVYKSDTIFDDVWTLGARTLQLTFTK